MNSPLTSSPPDLNKSDLNRSDLNKLDLNKSDLNKSNNSSSILRFQGQCIAWQISSKGRLKSVSLQLTDTVITLDIPKVLGHSLHNQFQIGSSLQAWVRLKKNSFKVLMLYLTGKTCPLFSPVGQKPCQSLGV